jgi:hypothetical protein
MLFVRRKARSEARIPVHITVTVGNLEGGDIYIPQKNTINVLGGEMSFVRIVIANKPNPTTNIVETMRACMARVKKKRCDRLIKNM